MPEESSPRGGTLQADSEQTEGQLAVCLPFSHSKVFHLGSVDPDALLGNSLEFHGPFAVVL